MGRRRGDGQWPCLRLAWSRGRATAARAPVGGVSGARIRSKQARARGEGLGGVRRPSGGKELGSTAAWLETRETLAQQRCTIFIGRFSSIILSLRANFCEPKSCRGKYRATRLMFELWSKFLTDFENSKF